jgi:serine/threonine protein kinase
MRDDDSAMSAYSRIESKKAIPCSQGRGTVLLYCVLWARSSSQQAFQPTKHVVVVKKLMRSHIDHALETGDSQEHPYNEIAIMQQLGDDVHVSSIHEALIDEKYLYIIMPWLGHDLLTTVFYRPNIDMYQVAQALMRDLAYIQQSPSCLIHRDVSPENILYIASSTGSACPLIDFAMALKCVELEGTPQHIAALQPWCGKHPYTSPEALAELELDFGVDIWSMGVVLLTLALRERLWENLWVIPQDGGGGISSQAQQQSPPAPQVDLMYSFFILEKGLADPDLLDQTIELFLRLYRSGSSHEEQPVILRKNAQGPIHGSPVP